MLGIRTRPRATLDNIRAFTEGLRYRRALQRASGTNIDEPEPPGWLAEYFERHTDGPGVWKWLHYFPAYERHLRRFVGREVHVVEVGVYSGGSLPMWRDYFGDDARIYGIDIEDACRAYASERIDIFIGDQADPSFWREFRRAVPRIDILIDDGGHQVDQQITTLKETLPAISPGGVYLCEDSKGASNAFHAFVDGFGRGLHTHNQIEPSILQQHVASIHRYPYLTVIEKPLLPVRAFSAPKHGTEWEPFLPGGSV